MRADFALANSLRNFPNMQEMNEALVNGINQTVGQDDVLFCLGDWSFGGIESVEDFRSRLNCSHIYFILGNHDHHIENESKNLQQLFVSVSHYKEIRVGEELLVLSHYSHRTWNHSQNGAWHLYGHSHSNLEEMPNGKSMDVGIDNAFKLLGEYRPFSFKEILSYLDKREIVFLDHHTPEGAKRKVN
jgi:calcineurin-like phosphoesterase family protein